MFFPVWACGAAGSALPWHGRGHRFDPDQVHQSTHSESNTYSRKTPSFRQWIRVILCQRRRHVFCSLAPTPKRRAHVGIQLSFTAYVRWLEAGVKADLTLMSESVMSVLASIVPTNTRPPLRVRRVLGSRPSRQTHRHAGVGGQR